MFNYKFKNNLTSILLTLLAAGTAGCTDEISDVINNRNSGDTFTLDVTLDVADMAMAQTRAFVDNPDYESLNLYIYEFDRNGDPLSNSLSQDLTGAIEKPTLNDDGDIHFTLTLNKTSEGKVLHFIALPNDVSFSLNLQEGRDTEGEIIPYMQVSGQTPVYWQRVEFPNGYGYFDVNNVWHEADDLSTKFNHVPMIRNFAKISFATPDPTSGFTLEGFALVNQPTRGTLAPWNVADADFPVLNDGNVMKKYSAVNETYKGYWPFDPVINVNRTSSEEADFTPQAKFLYERPNSSINNPYVLVKGKRTADGPSMYYKIDLGKPTETTPFEYYDILRNFEYQITIQNVSADGYSTIADAINGVTFNNLSFDVSTRQMNNVTNGRSMLWINQPTFVVTSDDDGETTIHFKFRYDKNFKTEPGYDNKEIAFIGLEVGEAIESVEGLKKVNGVWRATGDDDANGWREVTIKTKEPSPIRLSQRFTIYDNETGLGRSIEIIVRNPWNYTDAALYGIEYDTYSQYQTVVANHQNDWKGYVSSTPGQPVTVSFRIDDNIPEAMFPLEFVFEADPQNIENNKTGNLLVRTEPSYFSSVNQPTIKYVKTVTWADYNSELTEDNPTGTQVKTGGSTIHFVRARFLTIRTISGDNNRLRVYNKYFQEPGSANPVYLDFTFSAKSENAPVLQTE